LEGPYISPKDGFRGAHPLKWVQEPDWDDFLEYARASGKGILQVSLAPELPHAIEFIQNCTRHGIIVALAHHNASATTIQQAIDSGAKIATHLGNGCANTIHRHYNPLWPQLSDDRLWISMIADGFHLPPEMIQVFYKVKGANKIILTSDITRLAGLPAGEYKMMGSNVRLTKEGKIRLEAQDVLAGAALPLIKGVENMYKYTHCSLADAIHMATRNPASLNGLTDRGALLPGKRADIILFSFKEGVISIKETILAGKQVFKSNI
jgi:N-acetylglucosamine-6-phosphate deacetylase